VTTVIIVGTQLSYIPQHYSIVHNRSSLGINSCTYSKPVLVYTMRCNLMMPRILIYCFWIGWNSDVLADGHQLLRKLVFGVSARVGRFTMLQRSRTLTSSDRSHLDFDLTVWWALLVTLIFALCRDSLNATWTPWASISSLSCGSTTSYYILSYLSLVAQSMLSRTILSTLTRLHLYGDLIILQT